MVSLVPVPVFEGQITFVEVVVPVVVLSEHEGERDRPRVAIFS